MIKIRYLILIFSFSILNANENPVNTNNIIGKNNIIPVAILGGGPAGLSAAMCASRAGQHTVVFIGKKPGGQISDSAFVDNWPAVEKASGLTIMKKLENQATELGAYISYENIVDIDFSVWPFVLKDSNNTEYHALTVIIATGATPKKMGIKGENDYWLKGILSCGLCDAPLAKDADVVVIGDSDEAIERVVQLKKYAKKITLIINTNKLQHPINIQRKLHNLRNVKILYNKKIEEFKGDGKHLNTVVISDLKKRKQIEIPAQWAFLSLGFRPNTDLFKKYLSLDSNGYIIHSFKTQETSITGIFIAGNAGDAIYKLAVTASGDATKAALNASGFINKLPLDSGTKQHLENSLFTPKKVESACLEINNNEDLERCLKNNKFVIAHFFMPLCSTCREVEPIIDAISQKYKDKIVIAKIDRSKLTDIATKYSVEVVPLSIMFIDSKEKSRLSGKFDKAKLMDFISKNLKDK